MITETPLYNSISQLLEAFEQEHFDAEALKACGSNFITCNSIFSTTLLKRLQIGSDGQHKLLTSKIWIPLKRIITSC
uniref:hypothetical protein n=1 Tax=Vibrio cholerae TaxID=666 RepID=UPI003F58AB2E